MITATLLRHHAPLIARRSPISLLRCRCPTLAAQQLTSPQCLRLVAKRWESTAARQKTLPTRGRSPYVYPSQLTVYLAPFSQTALGGIIRIATIVVFALGTFIYAPAVYLDASAPNWLVPTALFGSAIPFLAATAFGPQITSIRVQLPHHVRKSREALFAFINNAPPATILRLQFIRWAPWLVTRDMPFSSLRRLPLSRFRLANIECVGQNSAEQREVLERYGWVGRMVGRYGNRYWVNVASLGGKDGRSQAPGAWERMWGQMPMGGKGIEKGEKRAVRGMLNRPAQAQVGAYLPGPPMKAGEGGLLSELVDKRERMPAAMPKRAQVLPPTKSGKAAGKR